MVCTLLGTVFVLALVASTAAMIPQNVEPKSKDHLLGIQNASKFWSYIELEPVVGYEQNCSILRDVFNEAVSKNKSKLCVHAYKCYVVAVRNRCEKYAALLGKFGFELMIRGHTHGDVLPAVSSALRSLVAGLEKLVHGDHVTLMLLHHVENRIHNHPDDPSNLRDALSEMATSSHDLVIFHSLKCDLNNESTTKTVTNAVHKIKDNCLTSINKLGSSVLNIITRTTSQSSGDDPPNINYCDVSFNCLYESIMVNSSSSSIFDTDPCILSDETLVDALDKLSKKAKMEFGSVYDESVNLGEIQY